MMSEQKSDSTILDEIAAKTRLRVAKAKEAAPFDQIREEALEQALTQQTLTKNHGTENGSAPPCRQGPRFEDALAKPGLSFICEVKKASPSKGIIACDFPYLQIAGEYEAAGAAAISVLTEPDYFLGSDLYLREIAAALTIPVLRKDFVIDPYQIYEAKLLGANAVLLIVALLDPAALLRYIQITAELGISALVEIHSEAEAEAALSAGARIIGVNNRDLKTFKVDLNVTTRLRKLIPAHVVTVAESGIRTADDIRALKDTGIDAVLVGESFMRADDKKQFLAELKAAY